MTSESAALANHNGKMVEEIVQTLLPELQYVGKNLDAVYHERPLEIKSCQRTCHRSDRGRGERSGRFWFRADQDKVLKEEDGFYALVVHDKGNLCFFLSYRSTPSPEGLFRSDDGFLEDYCEEGSMMNSPLYTAEFPMNWRVGKQMPSMTLTMRGVAGKKCIIR